MDAGFFFFFGQCQIFLLVTKSDISSIYCWKEEYREEWLEKLPGKQSSKHKQNIFQISKPKEKLNKSQSSIQLSLEEEMHFQIAGLTIRWRI